MPDDDDTDRTDHRDEERAADARDFDAIERLYRAVFRGEAPTVAPRPDRGRRRPPPHE